MAWLVITDLPTDLRCRKVYSNTGDERRLLASLRTQYPQSRVWTAASRRTARAIASSSNPDGMLKHSSLPGARAMTADEIDALAGRTAEEEHADRAAADSAEHVATLKANAPAEEAARVNLRAERAAVLRAHATQMQEQYGLLAVHVRTIDHIIHVDHMKLDTHGTLSDESIASLGATRDQHGAGKIAAIKYMRLHATRAPAGEWNPAQNEPGRAPWPAMVGLKAAKDAVELRMSKLDDVRTCYSLEEILHEAGFLSSDKN